MIYPEYRKNLSNNIIKYYSWFVIISKKQIYSKANFDSCEVAYHTKIVDDDKELNIQGLRDSEIYIYKRNAVFESILKNILS